MLQGRSTVFSLYSRFANAFVPGGVFGANYLSGSFSSSFFQGVLHIDHLAHWGNPLTSTRIAPTHAFWRTSLAENKNHGIKKEFGEPC